MKKLICNITCKMTYSKPAVKNILNYQNLAVFTLHALLCFTYLQVAMPRKRHKPKNLKNTSRSATMSVPSWLSPTSTSTSTPPAHFSFNLFCKTISVFLTYQNLSVFSLQAQPCYIYLNPRSALLEKNVSESATLSTRSCLPQSQPRPAQSGFPCDALQGAVEIKDFIRHMVCIS